MKIILVEWIDASRTNRCDDPKEIMGPLKMVAVGMLLKSTKTYISIAQDFSEVGSAREILSIPKRNIVKTYTFIQNEFINKYQDIPT